MVDPMRFAAVKQARLDVQKAEAELASQRQSIDDFEVLVSRRLGSLLDQLSALEGEVESLTAQVRNIRDQRLYGEHQMDYVPGAPRSELKAGEYVPFQNVFTEPEPDNTAGKRNSSVSQGEAVGGSPADPETDMKRIYRRLARAYHPDLAVDGADRAQRNRQMAFVNQAYAAGDLEALYRLSQEEGLEPYVYKFSKPAIQPDDEKSELERLQQRLAELRQQIVRLNNHPNVQLNLEVQVARQKGRDLLGEMAQELRRKIARKTAERDYLRSQIAAISQL
jgi:hypothetical protein